MSALVTGIIPVHNHEKWVGDAVNSIVNSDYDNKRLVVVDDGSTDKSFETVLSLMQLHKKVDFPNDKDEPKQIFQGFINNVPIIAIQFHRAYGPSFSRNYAIKTGWDGTDLFAFLDSDDWYETTKIAKSVEIWSEMPDLIGVLYSDYSTVDQNGVRHRQFKEPFSRSRLLQECIINNDSLYSKKVLEKCGLYDENLRVSEDYDLHIRATEHCIAVHIPEDLISIRVGHHSSTSTVTKEVWQQNYNRVFQKLQERMSRVS